MWRHHNKKSSLKADSVSVGSFSPSLSRRKISRCVCFRPGVQDVSSTSSKPPRRRNVRVSPPGWNVSNTDSGPSRFSLSQSFPEVYHNSPSTSPLSSFTIRETTLPPIVGNDLFSLFYVATVICEFRCRRKRNPLLVPFPFLLFNVPSYVYICEVPASAHTDVVAFMLIVISANGGGLLVCGPLRKSSLQKKWGGGERWQGGR